MIFVCKLGSEVAAKEFFAAVLEEQPDVFWVRLLVKVFGGVDSPQELAAYLAYGVVDFSRRL